MLKHLPLVGIWQARSNCHSLAIGPCEALPHRQPTDSWLSSVSWVSWPPASHFAPGPEYGPIAGDCLVFGVWGGAPAINLPLCL